AVEHHAPARGGLDAAHDAQERRLAAAVGTEQADEVAGLGGERHRVDDGDQVVLADAVDLELHARHRVSRRATVSKTSLSVSVMTRIITSAHTNTICVARISRLKFMT